MGAQTFKGLPSARENCRLLNYQNKFRIVRYLDPGIGIRIEHYTNILAGIGTGIENQLLELESDLESKLPELAHH